MNEEITIVCEHDGKPDTIVATLWKEPTRLEWTAATVDGENPRTRLMGDYSVDQLVAGVRPQAGRELSQTSRYRWEFICRRCKFRVVARGEKLDPVLDALTLGGVSRVSLRALAPRV